MKIDSVSRMEIINYLIQKNNYKSYLEIGCQNNVCFNAINIIHKIGVDPEKGGTHRMTSDDFFKQNEQKFDIVFVDGLHHADAVEKDIDNALKVLNEDGIIICHDMIPSSYESQIVPRQTKVWNGDCWKAFVKLNKRSDLTIHVIQTDCGLGVIEKGWQEPFEVRDEDLTYDKFVENQQKWLRAIEVEEFYKLY